MSKGEACEMSWNDEKSTFPKCHHNSRLNFRGRAGSSISGLDEVISTSNQHRWRVYLNIKVWYLVSFVSSIALAGEPGKIEEICGQPIAVVADIHLVKDNIEALL
jgi:hypothetical protein